MLPTERERDPPCNRLKHPLPHDEQATRAASAQLSPGGLCRAEVGVPTAHLRAHRNSLR